MLDVEVDLVRNLGAFGSFRSLAEEEESGGQNDHQRDDNSLNVSHVEDHGRGKLMERMQCSNPARVEDR